MQDAVNEQQQQYIVITQFMFFLLSENSITHFIFSFLLKLASRSIFYVDIQCMNFSSTKGDWPGFFKGDNYKSVMCCLLSMILICYMPIVVMILVNKRLLLLYILLC